MFSQIENSDEGDYAIQKSLSLADIRRKRPMLSKYSRGCRPYIFRTCEEVSKYNWANCPKHNFNSMIGKIIVENNNFFLQSITKYQDLKIAVEFEIETETKIFINSNVNGAIKVTETDIDFFESLIYKRIPIDAIVHAEGKFSFSEDNPNGKIIFKINWYTIVNCLPEDLINVLLEERKCLAEDFVDLAIIEDNYSYCSIDASELLAEEFENLTLVDDQFSYSCFDDTQLAVDIEDIILAELMSFLLIVEDSMMFY